MLYLALRLTQLDAYPDNMVTFTGEQGLGCHIAIADLPVELGRLRQGEAYWIAAATEAACSALITQMLLAADPAARAVLICSVDPTGLLADLPANQGPADLRTYRLSGEPLRALRALPKDLDRSLRPRERTIIMRLSADYFSVAGDRLEAVLVGWRKWLQENNCVLLVLAHGDHALKAVHGLLRLNHVLSGLARLEPEGTEYSYSVLHWRNALDAVGLTRLRLALTDQGYAATRHSTPRTEMGNDRSRFLFERIVLEGVPVFMADDWHVYGTAAEVAEQAMRANSATVVFGLRSGADLAALAKTLHVLRKQRGPALKLVIREMSRTLRYQDEQLLLACGATLVVPSDTSLPRFFSLLESVQGKVYERELTGDPEALIERGRAVRLRGVVGAEKFLSYLEHVQALAGATADGVLVAMNPVPGLSPALAMGQLQLRRFGDVACELGGLVYLYLFGCHPHLVEVALGNVFALPYQEIFADHAAYVSTRQIADEHESMKRVFEARRQGPQGVADAPGSERPWPAAGNVAAMAAGPQAPRLMALPLRK